MKTEYPLHEEVGQVFGVRGGCAWYQVPLLGQAVDHYPDGVATARLWESNNKVHADILS